MSTNLTPPTHSTQNSFAQLLNLHNWLTKIHNGMKQDKEYDDWVGYTLPEKVRNRYLQFFDDCKQSVQLKDIAIMIEHTKLMVEQYKYTQPIENKEVKETVKPTVQKEFKPISVRNYNPSQNNNTHWGPVDRTLLEHKVYKSLVPQSKLILIDLLTLFSTTNKEEIDYCYSHCIDNISERSFRSLLKELETKGFISISRNVGKSNKVKLSYKWITFKLDKKELDVMNKREVAKQKLLTRDRNKLNQLQQRKKSI